MWSIPGEEVMLIFGGLTYRDGYYSTGTNVFDQCEIRRAEIEADATDKEPGFSLCSEQILNDVWKYHLGRDEWYQIKPGVYPDYNDVYTAPQPRYGHSGNYIVRIEDTDPNNKYL